MILKSGRNFQPDADLLEVLRGAYPNIDIDAEIRKMDAWLLCNPGRRKTERGIHRFINSWLQRARPISQSTSTRHRSLEQDLTDTSWAGL